MICLNIYLPTFGNQMTGGGNSNIFYFHPEPWGKMNPFWRAYFSTGLKPPTSPYSRCCTSTLNTMVLFAPELPRMATPYHPSIGEGWIHEFRRIEKPWCGNCYFWNCHGKIGAKKKSVHKKSTFLKVKFYLLRFFMWVFSSMARKRQGSCSITKWTQWIRSKKDRGEEWTGWWFYDAIFLEVD